MRDHSVASLADAFHTDGFVALDATAYMLTDEEVQSLLAAVTKLYDGHIARANDRGIDLTKPANAEVIPGFYVREGGRVDMQLINRAPSWSGVALKQTDQTADGAPVDGIDLELLRSLENRWQCLVRRIFQPAAQDTNDTVGDEPSHSRPNYVLEYIGCVVARPDDKDQNWHLDGVHRNLTEHEPADRINVFIPLVDIDEHTGGTEMKKGSQSHDQGQRGSSFAGYANLESVTHYVSAGTPIIMDYRVWHRGLANKSAVRRPLLYFKYSRHEQVASVTGKRAATTARDDLTKPKKRVALAPQRSSS